MISSVFSHLSLLYLLPPNVYLSSPSSAGCQSFPSRLSFQKHCFVDCHQFNPYSPCFRICPGLCLRHRVVFQEAFFTWMNDWSFLVENPTNGVYLEIWTLYGGAYLSISLIINKSSVRLLCTELGKKVITSVSIPQVRICDHMATSLTSVENIIPRYLATSQ